MANIFRGPLIVGRRDVPLQRAIVFSAPSLLATTLAVAGQIPLPLGADQQTASAPHLVRFGADTSLGSSRLLLTAVASPQPQPQPAFASVDASPVKRVGADVFQNTTITVLAPDIYAPGNLTELIPVIAPVRINADTSQSAFAVTNPPPVLPPFVNAQYTAPDRIRPVADGSRGFTPASVQSAPLVNAPNYSVQLQRSLFDTSVGTSKALTKDATFPVVNAPQFQVYRQPAVADTSQSASVPLATYVPPPPLYQHDWPAPIEYRWQHLHTWDAQAFVPTIPAPPVPPAPVIRGNDDGEKKRRLQRNTRAEIREALKQALEGPRKEEVKKIVRPFAKFAEVTPDTVNLDKLRVDLERVERLLALAQEDEDDDWLMLLL